MKTLTEAQVTNLISRPSGIKFSGYQKRFCETCQRLLPYSLQKALKNPAKKGWKCDDCRAKK